MSHTRRSRLFGGIAAAILATMFGVLGLASAQARSRSDQAPKPTVVLVHGAFADSSGFNEVTRRLQNDGYKVYAVADPLRGVASDAAAVRSVLDDIDGPVVLVGHSYAGSVISEAAVGEPNVKALVYLAAFLPDSGETVGSLVGEFPGSTLSAAIHQVPVPNGGTDLYVDRDKFPQQFAADVPVRQARLLAVSQRPAAATTLTEPETAPAWRDIPSYDLIADADRNIPPALQQFMAHRAHSVTLTIKGASHLVFVSHPGTTAAFIERAARTPR